MEGNNGVVSVQWETEFRRLVSKVHFAVAQDPGMTREDRDAIRATTDEIEIVIAGFREQRTLTVEEYGVLQGAVIAGVCVDAMLAGIVDRDAVRVVAAWLREFRWGVGVTCTDGELVAPVDDAIGEWVAETVRE